METARNGAGGSSAHQPSANQTLQWLALHRKAAGPADDGRPRPEKSSKQPVRIGISNGRLFGRAGSPLGNAPVHQTDHGIGFVSDGASVLDTRLPGNGNHGHAYGTGELADNPEKLDELLEYLKTL